MANSPIDLVKTRTSAPMAFFGTASKSPLPDAREEAAAINAKYIEPALAVVKKLPQVRGGKTQQELEELQKALQKIASPELVKRPVLAP